MQGMKRAMAKGWAGSGSCTTSLHRGQPVLRRQPWSWSALSYRPRQHVAPSLWHAGCGMVLGAQQLRSKPSERAVGCRSTPMTRWRA